MKVRTIRRYLAISKLLFPILIPLVYTIINFSKELINKYKAKQLHVDTETLTELNSTDLKISAKIHNLQRSIEDLKQKNLNNTDILSFVTVMQKKLADLSFSAQTVAKLGKANQKPTVKLINDQLLQIEQQIIRKLPLQ